MLLSLAGYQLRPVRGIAKRDCIKTLTCAFSNSSDQPGADGKFRITLKLPYHCNFGQQLWVVGSADSLGSWDVQRGVQLEWTEGDVWTTELAVEASGGSLDLEYKYVVRDDDGNIAEWKPGGNCMLRYPQEGTTSTLPDRVSVRDTWDGSFREVEVKLPDTPSTSGRRSMRSKDRIDNIEELDTVSVVSLAAERALAELDLAITESMKLLDAEGSSGVATPAMVEADRMVAAAARRAAAMSKALDAAKDPAFEGRLLGSGDD